MYCLSHLILDDPALEGASLIHADDDERLGQVEDAITKLVTESRFEIRAAWNQLVERGRECRAEEEKQAEEEADEAKEKLEAAGAVVSID